MRKFLILFTCLALACPAAFAKTEPVLPDNIYFRAMNDEMKRTLKELRSKGAPDPYYAAYKITRTSRFTRSASFGALYSDEKLPNSRLSAVSILGVGSDQNDQLGFENNRFSYEPESIGASDSYDGLRNALWLATDGEYIQSADSYVKKQAYKRKKALRETLPDVTPAPQAAVFEEVGKFAVPNAAQWEDIVKRLSLKGKEVSQLDNFLVWINIGRWDYYYLNSSGGAYQLPFTRAEIILSARLRNKDGYVQQFMDVIPVADYLAPDEKMLAAKTDAFLTEMAERYNAYKAEAYLGPVLLRPTAAAQFVRYNFVWSVENVKPLLSDQYEHDPYAGNFREKKGMRVLSNVVDISDKPLLREYKGLPLFYMPVDDEGVPSQNLQLTSLGRLRAFPLSRRPVGENHQSNGHARLASYSYPREALTNVFVEAKTPLSAQALDEEFLAMCRDWEQEYCYEVESLEDDGAHRLWRVYAEDGRRVPVYGANINLSARSLRDIAAAGGEEGVIYGGGNEGRISVIVAPSLLLEEAEILPTDAKPDRAPFVPKP